jgi:hypothetical protein
LLPLLPPRLSRIVIAPVVLFVASANAIVVGGYRHRSVITVWPGIPGDWDRLDVNESVLEIGQPLHCLLH